MPAPDGKRRKPVEFIGGPLDGDVARDCQLDDLLFGFRVFVDDRVSRDRVHVYNQQGNGQMTLDKAVVEGIDRMRAEADAVKADAARWREAAQMASNVTPLVEWLRSEADGMMRTTEFFAGDGDEDLTVIAADAARLRLCADTLVALSAHHTGGR